MLYMLPAVVYVILQKEAMTTIRALNNLGPLGVQLNDIAYSEVRYSPVHNGCIGMSKTPPLPQGAHCSVLCSV